MRTDAQLTQWREAAASGGLPQPHRNRWQPLRAGVVNLWEFEAVEYWYADGWAQLMGRNETGKSSLMALTTLIPWVADTSSDKIDTLGRSGKQFSYYVRPTGNDGDRRDASASHFHGWVWVEYGRLTSAGPSYFTTLLYSSARSATPRVNLEWCTAHHLRVREGLVLTRGRDVETPKSIAAGTTPGFTVHPSAQSYKAVVAGQLLGSTVERLETIGKILKVTRTPKLGAHLDVRFVTDHLRGSLPELRRSEIEQLAQGWDQLDQIRHDLQRAQDAAATVARFSATMWHGWLGAKLRLGADEAADRRTRFDNVRRREDAARKDLGQAEAADTALVTRIDEARRSAETAVAAEEELRRSSDYRDARERIDNADRAEEALRAAARQLDRGLTDLTQAGDRAGHAHIEHERQVEVVALNRERLQDRSDTTRASATAAGLPEVGAKLDADRIRQRMGERRGHLDRAGELLRRLRDADDHATRLEEAAATQRNRADDATANARATWDQAQAAHDALALAIPAWAVEVPGPAPRHEAWVDALPLSEEHLGRPTLRETIGADWFEPRRSRLDDERRSAASAAEQARQKAEQLEAEISELQAAGVDTPASPVLWSRRERTGVAGAPFWRLVNPLPGPDDVDLAHLEAALAAAGILDAWVDDSGVRGPDTFVAAPDAVGQGPRLSSVLVVADEAGELADVVQEVLDGIALRGTGEMLPDSGLAVALDGRWRNSGLVGSAAPAHHTAEWLGEAAREAQRRRRIQELTAARDAERADASRHHAAEVAAREELNALADALDRAPSDAGLRTTILLAAEREERAASERQEAATAEEAGRGARAAADARRSEMLRFTTDVGLPATADALAGVRDALHVLDKALDALATALRDLRDAEHLEHDLARRLADAEQERDQRHRIHAEAERQHTVALARLEALRAAIDADDAAVLERLEALRREATEASATRDRLTHERNQVLGRLGAARERLGSVETEREQATAERDEAFARFRSLVDRGVVRELGIEVPEPDSSAIEHVRSQVAQVRRAVEPRGWSDEARANGEVLQRLRSRLEGSAREVNSDLEQGGRSLKLEPEGDLVRIEVTVDTNGTTLLLKDAVEDLSHKVTTLQQAYDARVQETLDELLGSTFLEHMRERVGTATNLVDEINQVLAGHATTTSATAMRIRLEAGQNREVLDAITGSALLDPAVAEQVRGFLRDRVDEAKRQAEDLGQGDWHDALARQLDYREWYDVTLERRIGASGRWSPLTTRSFAEMSGGARAVMLMLPLVATLAALYRDMPEAPRPIWLDEAFDGLDVANRSMVMDLLRQFDLDVLLAGPGRLVNVQAVPAAAIYQVVRAPAPLPGADLTLELWAGGSLEAIELPLSWLQSPAPEPPAAQDSLL